MSVKLGIRKKSCSQIQGSSLTSSKENTSEMLPNSSHNECVVIAKKVCVAALMGAVWILLLLPIILYHFPVETNKVSSNVTNTINGNMNCSAAYPYPVQASSICRVTLVDFISTKMNCNPTGTPLILRDGSSSAQVLLFGLDIQQSSDKCRKAVIPFMCLHLFGLCDSSGVSFQPTMQQCLDVRDELCAAEWELALSLNFDLPDCGGLPKEQFFCPAQNRSTSGIDDYPVSVPQNISEPIPCRRGFFREGNRSGPCFPHCDNWKEYSESEVIGTDVVILGSAVIGVVAGLAVIAISIIRFVFPSIFVVYLTLDLILADFFIVVTYFDRYSLYCSSANLVKSISKVTPFCVISGMVFVYTLLQTAIWWLCHTTALLWKIRYPFHARSYQTSHKIKYIHIACMIAGVLIPFLPIVTSMAEFAVDLKTNTELQQRNVTFWSGGLGYLQIRFPPVLCAGRDGVAVYYTSVLPINIIVLVGLTELILLFWTVHRRYGLIKASNSKSVFNFGTPERKILVTLCYYVLMAVVGLSRFTMVVQSIEDFKQKLIEYFACESDPSRLCDRNEFRQYSNPILTAISLVLIGLFPAVNLIYAINVQELREKCFFQRRPVPKLNCEQGTSSMKLTTLQ